MQAPKNILKNCDKMSYFQCFNRLSSNKFVPKHEPANPEDVQKLEKFLANKQNVLVLTGAGISTESGKIYFHLKNVHSLNDCFLHFRMHNRNS